MEFILMAFENEKESWVLIKYYDGILKLLFIFLEEIDYDQINQI